MAEGASNKNVASATVAIAAREYVGRLLEASQYGSLDSFKDAARSIAGQNGNISAAIAEVKDANGRGPLHFAARGGNMEVLKYLIEELKLPVDQKDDEGETPLLHAAQLGKYDAAAYLLDHGADVSATSQGSEITALHHAAAAGSLDLMHLLLEHGAHVDAQSDSGTPLTWASGHANVEAVKLLLDKKADPNVVKGDHVTALITGAAVGSSDIVKLLIKHGATVNTSAGGVTALHIAADISNETMVNILLEAGANPDAKDGEGSRAIDAAAEKSDRAIVDLLLPVTTPGENVEWTTDAIIASKQAAPVAKEELSPEMLDKFEDLKARGAKAVKAKDYASAIEAYTQALDINPMDAIIYSNRSLCWTFVGEAENALKDAKTAVALKPEWMKAHYREGVALRLLERFDEAASSFYEGMLLEPNNDELKEAFREAVESGQKFHRQKNGEP